MKGEEVKGERGELRERDGMKGEGGSEGRGRERREREGARSEGGREGKGS